MYRVHTGGEVLEASLRGRMKRGSRKRVVVGDLVILGIHPGDSVTIEEIHPRRSLLKRRSPGKRRGVRVVASNVDQVVVVGSVAEPEWDPHLIDRFIVVAEANQLPVLVVLNKCDLDPDVEPLVGAYREVGYPVLVTSASSGEGLAGLKSSLANRVSLIAGPTGVGKSSLLNALQPGLELRTRSVSPRSRGGRHTTVSAEMHPLDDGGFVVDTPGLSDIGLWGVEPLEVEKAFPEVARAGAGCRFDNCRHSQEPGCAVIQAVESGEISSQRLDSYRRLSEEAERAARPWT